MFATKKAKSKGMSTALSFVGLSLVAGVLVAAAITPAVAISGLTANSTLGVFNDLPTFLDVGQIAQRSSIYAKNAKGQDVKLASFYAQDRIDVSWDQINDYVKDAATSGEDPRFYEHGAIDLMGTARAILSNVTGNEVQGGSSITQQYVKNVLVQKAEGISDPVAREKAYNEATATTIERKLKEMKLAIGVEQKYSKQQILNGYLNITGFGGRVYGIEAAAEYYYSKTANTVTIPEAASLIAMVQNPEYMRIDDEANLKANKGRRDYIINKMYDEGKITAAERDESIATPVTPKISSPARGCATAPYGAANFCDYITWIIKNDPVFGEDEDARWSAFERGGWKIYTTLNLELQKTTFKSLTGRMPAKTPEGNIGSASTSVEAGTGRILAMVQSKKFSNDPALAAKDKSYTSLNFSTDRNYGGSSGFQPGSTYKIFTVMEWLKQGHGLGEMVDARQKDLDLSKFRNSCEGVGGGIWQTRNDGGDKGRIMTVADGIRTSMNHAFFAMAMQLDLCNIRKDAEAFGVHRADGNPLGSTPASVIGTNEVAPLSMVSMMAGVANMGLYCSPIAIDKIIDFQGNEITPPKSSCNQALPKDVTLGLIAGLKGPIYGGTASASNPNDGIEHFGKTGSTDSYVNTWMLGASSKVATVVWVGNITGRVSLAGISINGIAASTIRHYIWKPIMLKADKMFGGKPFPAPDSKFLSGRSVVVPDVRGVTLAEAKKLIEGVGLTFVNGGVTDSNMPVGVVSSTGIAAGKTVPTATIIKVYTSNGTGIAVPSFIGMTEAAATAAAATNGWVLQITTVLKPPACVSPTVGCVPVPITEHVTTQSVKAGSFLSPGKTIKLTIEKPQP